MNDQEISHGLSLLVDEDAPLVVDVDTVITKARLRTKRRNALIGTALSAAVIITAAVALTPLRHAPPTTPGQPSWPECASISKNERTAIPEKCVRADGVVVAMSNPEPVYDERAERLSAALATALPSIVPASVTYSDHTFTPNRLPGAPALKFFKLLGPDNASQDKYIAAATANSQATPEILQIRVESALDYDPGGECIPDLACVDERRPDGSHVVGINDQHNLRGHVHVKHPNGTMVTVSYEAVQNKEAPPTGPSPFDLTTLTKIADIPDLRA